MSDEETDEQVQLRIVRSAVFCAAMSSPTPCSIGYINGGYRDLEDRNIPYKDFGYPTLEKFLLDHPKLEPSRDENGALVFKASLTKECAHLQELIAKQKKKKKKGKGYAKRGGPRFFRPVSNDFGTGDVRRSLGANHFASSNFSRQKPQTQSMRGKTLTFTNRSNSLHQTSRSKSQDRSRPSSSLGRPFSAMGAALPPPPTTPEEGVRRILKVFTYKRRCGNYLDLRLFCRFYADCHRTAFTGAELNKYFKTNNLSDIGEKYLRDQVEVIRTVGGVAFRIPHTGDGDSAAVVEKPKSAVPSPIVLSEHLITWLFDIYPKGVPVDSLTQLYEERYERHIDPEKMYCHSWEEIITKHTNKRLEMRSDRCIYVERQFAKNAGTNVSLSSLGIEWGGDSSYESDTDLESTLRQSTVANSSLSDSSSVLTDRGIGEMKEKKKRTAPATSTSSSTIIESLLSLPSLMKRKFVGKGEKKASSFLFSSEGTMRGEEKEEGETTVDGGCGGEESPVVSFFPPAGQCPASGGYQAIAIYCSALKGRWAYSFTCQNEDYRVYGAHGFLREDLPTLVQLYRYCGPPETVTFRFACALCEDMNVDEEGVKEFMKRPGMKRYEVNYFHHAK